MEERIIDDEYARGIRLKKTKDGYVDVTDELAAEARTETEDGASELPADGAEGETDGRIGGEKGGEEAVLDLPDAELDALSGEEEGEEVTFEFPELEEDDEDLVNLTPEEAMALRKKKEEEEAARKAEYKRLCEEGEELLLSSSFRAAELKFEKALVLAEDASEAAVGYWRAKTSDFAEPDVLMAEYLETGFESLENDLGDDATEKLRERYKDVFAARLKALEEEGEPLEKSFTEKQTKRRAVLKKRISSARLRFIAAAVPTLVFLILAFVFGVRIATRPDGLFVYLTIGAGVLFFVCFIVFGFFTNGFVNVLRLNRENEDPASTEEGKKLLEIRAYKELYSHFVG